MKFSTIILCLLIFSCSSENKSKSFSNKAKAQTVALNKRNVFILDELVIKEFPRRKKDGKKWDAAPFGDADLFFDLKKEDTTLRSNEQNEIRDFTNADAPYSFELDYTTTDLNETITLYLYDKDAVDNDLVDSFSFKPSKLSANNSANYTGSYKDLKITLKYRFQ